jgi:hypothetical protein
VPAIRRHHPREEGEAMSDYLTVRLNEDTETTQAKATESLRW